MRQRGEVTILGSIVISALTCFLNAWLGLAPHPTPPSAPVVPTVTTENSNAQLQPAR